MADEVLAPDPRYYPKAKYCIDGSNRVVADPRAEASLDPAQWFDNPSQAKAASDVVTAKVMSATADAFANRFDSDESWEASEALLQPKRRGRPPKVTQE